MQEKSTAIVLAAGQGKRMQSKIQKQFLLLGEKPIIYYSLACFEKSDRISEIVLVTDAGSISYCQNEIVEKYGFHKVKRIVAGGKERYDSVYEGLKACEDASYVFIHDSARPFLDETMIERGYQEVKRSGACIAAVPAKDTIKLADSDGYVAATVDRANTWIVQTPQVFSYELIRKSYDRIRATDMSRVTDDAMVVESVSGEKVRIYQGSYENIKMTTPDDLLIGEAILKKFEKFEKK